MTSKQQPPEVEEISVLDLSERIYQGDGVAIYLTTRPLESSDDLLFAPVNSNFGGTLATQVSQQSGIPLPEGPPEGGGYTLITDGSGTQSLALIQTVGTDQAPADNLAENLRAFAEAYGIDVARIWVPFMGTGAGGLTYPDAGAIICAQLLEARTALPASMPLTIDLALPRNTDEEEFWRIAEWLKGYLEEVFPSVSDDPVPAETRKLLDRKFYAQIGRDDAKVKFEFNEILAPTTETVVFLTKAALSSNPSLERLLAPPKNRALITLSEEGWDAYYEVNTKADKGVIDMRRMSQSTLNAHLGVISDRMTANADNPDDKVMDVFIPVEPPQSEQEHNTIADFVAAINSSTLPELVKDRLTFRLAFNEPLSDADHATLRQTIKRTIEDLGGTYHPPTRGTANAPNEMPDKFHSDHALTDPDQDQLGRDAIAGAIATNVGRVWDAQMEAKRPFAVHLSGRWGSGKSSILSFLRVRLENDKRYPTTTPGTIYEIKKQGWIVIDYNAWQMQEAGPAWWSLLNTVKEEGYKELGPDGYYPRIADWLWQKTRVAKTWLVTLAIVVALILTYGWLNVGDLIPAKGDNNAESPIAFVLAVIAVLVPLGTLAGMVQSWSKSATETAEAVRDLQSDPTAVVKERYKRVIECIDRPVAVFIDDLDRCEAKFVVDLLQSLQTAYADTPVLYVVAADRNWIVSAYNQVYKDFTPEISKPGAPLGYLFVKKIFQLSVPVPDLAPGDSTKLAEVLLKTKTVQEPPTKTVAQREQAIDAAAAEGDVEEVTRIVKEGASEGQVLGAKAIEAVTNPDNQQELRHELLGYSHLFDANPRAIKRLINALTFRQGYAASSGAYRGFEVMARWTILSLRYPNSADLLCETPSRIDEVFAGPPQMYDIEFPNREEASQILEGLTKDDIEKVAAFG